MELTRGSILIICFILSFLRLNGQILEEEDRKVIIDAHNEARRDVDPTATNIREMEWSDCLAEVAYDYLKKCTGFAHNPDRQTEAAAKSCEASDQFVGENLYQSPGPVTDITAVTTLWANEKENYDYESGICSDVCGHYTQMVWFDSFLVGCTEYDQVNCGETGTIIACNYARGGNIIGEKPYTDGEQCSGCESPWDNCNDGLCAKSDGSSLLPSIMEVILIVHIIILAFML